MQTIENIIELEVSEDYKTAFEEYRKLFSINPEVELWKHYYFFLWYITVESYSLQNGDFINENKIEILLKEVGISGLETFKNNPEVLFILGYTISLFPYYFGDFEELKILANKMLEAAFLISPDDIIYKLTYLATKEELLMDYKKVCIEAAPEVLIRFRGKGLLNSYFRHVLYRVN